MNVISCDNAYQLLMGGRRLLSGSPVSTTN